MSGRTAVSASANRRSRNRHVRENECVLKVTELQKRISSSAKSELELQSDLNGTARSPRAGRCGAERSRQGICRIKTPCVRGVCAREARCPQQPPGGGKREAEIESRPKLMLRKADTILTGSVNDP